ncbi:MAG TPA: ASCH domain-containing protein, partial [Armatimonadetes bacterium]|nr:ASCH domain-containing protein [Armatimonadota bacterium]
MIGNEKVRYIGRSLMIRGKYAKKILEGIKRTTIRRGIVRPKYDEVIIHSGGKPICRARIIRVDHKKLKELTNYDAVKDGFGDLLELLEELDRLYGEIDPNEWITIIEFKVVERISELEAKHPYLGLRPVEIAELSLKYLGEELDSKEQKIFAELVKSRSLRKVAKKLYGSPLNRKEIRRSLRRALKMLIDK